MTDKDRQHLEAAEGWLGLGDWQSAEAELEKISDKMRAHPEVLHVRWKVYEGAGKWESALEVGRVLTKLWPDCGLSWLKATYALHELMRTHEAFEILANVARKFDDDWRIRYYLARYACRLKHRQAAFSWVGKAVNLNPQARLTALDDPALEAIWVDIRSSEGGRLVTLGAE